jgi:serine/threonine-protein kinase
VTLAAGTRIGPYEVITQIGEGGIGEVYRARDPRLNRFVALKVLRPGALDPESRDRFQREAQAVAALNHPNIVTLYSAEDDAGTTFLTMELVDGRSLAELLPKQGLPLDRVLKIAIAVADAIAAAHQRGITHRDLKPANIMLGEGEPDGRVKVLDFGLAKLTGMSPNGETTTVMPTELPTSEGRILGTVSYMSPEQAEGKPVDARSDLFSLGVILYELATGRRPFRGETSVSIISSIVKDTPPSITTLNPSLPRELARIVRRALAKDPEDRYQSAKDLRNDLRELQSSIASGEVQIGPPTTLHDRNRLWRFVAVGLGIVAIGAVAFYAGRRDVRPMEVNEFVDTLPEPGRLIADTSSVAISRDGRVVVYQVFDRIGYRLIRRSISSELEGKPIGDLGATEPFFSPDGEWVGFRLGGVLKKVSVGGGPSEQIATLPNSFAGAFWAADGTILLGGEAAGLQRVSKTGDVTPLHKPSNGRSVLWPQMLPGERAVIYTERASPTSMDDELTVLDLQTGRAKPLFPGFAGHYVPSGHLVFLKDDKIWAVAFDPVRLESHGTPKIVREDVRREASGRFMGTAVADDAGTLVYAMPQGLPQRNLVWRRRDQGVDQPVAKSEARAYANPRVSPDGKWIAVSIREGVSHIWIWDVERSHLKQLTSDTRGNQMEAWFPDSKRLAFSQAAAQHPEVYWQAADGSGRPLPLSESSSSVWPVTVSQAGIVLESHGDGPAVGSDVLLLRPGRKDPESLLPTSATERNPDVSPDGRFLAFESDRTTGQFEIYVRPFPNVQESEWPITKGRGGVAPRWSPDGRELFYWKQAGSTVSIMAIPVVQRPSFQVIGEPRELFHGTYAIGSWDRNYDVAKDGRFLLMKDAGSTRDQIAIVQNWLEKLKTLVPTK